MIMVHYTVHVGNSAVSSVEHYCWSAGRALACTVSSDADSETGRGVGRGHSKINLNLHDQLQGDWRGGLGV